jgi:short subunit dehydrogenase-like uncharacterized protein
MRQFPLVVFGASGYTGRLICAELQRRGLSFAIAGRQRAKLEALRDKLRGLPAGAGAKAEPEIIVADVADRASLARMAEAAQILIDCVGPFALYGPPVLDAALAAGTHYLDITGEYPYMLETYRRHGEALRRDVLLVNAVGFDVVPTDVVAVLAATAFADLGLTASDLSRVDIAFAVRTPASRGTARSVLEGTARSRGVGAAWVAGQLLQEPVGAKTWEAPLPSPIGPQTCVSVPWGDVATAPRSTGSPNVRVFVAVPRAAARALPLLRPLLPLVGAKPVQKLLGTAIDYLPEGPGDGKKGAFGSAVCAEAFFHDGRTATAWLSLPDGYTLTAHVAAHCAELCLASSFAARGALTPTQAFGARTLLDGMIAIGAQWGLRTTADR